MSVLINADTSDGLKLTSDTSGEIKLQSAGADIATVDSSGITMASGKVLAATGHVLQVVQSTTNTQTTSSSTSYISVSLSANITPSSTSNKVLVFVFSPVEVAVSGEFRSTIYRDSTDIAPSTSGLFYLNSGSSATRVSGASMSILDSPSSTSSITYSARMKTSGIQGVFNKGSAYAQITLMEIAG